MRSRVDDLIPLARPNPFPAALAVGAGALCVLAVVHQAWLSDDAVISLRAVANTVVGNGATFNVLERVQVYSHPLWFLLLVGANTIVYDPILTALLIGVLCTVGYLAVLVHLSRQRSWYLTAALLAVLATSPAFIEWSTSGLENSLAYLLFAVLIGVVAPRVADEGGVGASVTLGLVAAGIVLTRMDLAVLAGPIVIGVLWKRAAVRPLVVTAAGALVPLVAWFGFSVRYYGYALPNTAYAKLNLEIPFDEVVFRGVNYLRISGARQPLSVVLLVVAVSYLVAELRRGSWDRAGIAVGSVLYLGYVVSLGGDFMEGRFLAVPVAVAALALATSPLVSEPSGTPTALPMLLGGAALVSAIAPVSTPWIGEAARSVEWSHHDDGYAGVADERGFYVSRGMGLWSLMDRDTGDHDTHIRMLREAFSGWPQVSADAVDRVEVMCGGLGRQGLLLGPRVHLIDPCGLADPTLARTTFRASDFDWRSGHYHRDIPDGYADAVLTGDAALIEDVEVRAIFREVSERVR